MREASRYRLRGQVRHTDAGKISMLRTMKPRFRMPRVEQAAVLQTAGPDGIHIALRKLKMSWVHRLKEARHVHSSSAGPSKSRPAQRPGERPTPQYPERRPYRNRGAEEVSPESDRAERFQVRRC